MNSKNMLRNNNDKYVNCRISFKSNSKLRRVVLLLILICFFLVFTPCYAQVEADVKLESAPSYFHSSFGIAVDIEGPLAIVGMAGYDNGYSSPFYESGAAFIFSEVSTGVWQEDFILIADDSAGNDALGKAVALAPSGSTAFLNAYVCGNTLGQEACYIFTETGVGFNWIQLAKLVQASPGFGSAIAVEGSNVFIGGYNGDTDAGSAAGTVHFYSETSLNVWSSGLLIEPDDAAAGKQFGKSCSISGNTLFVGAWFDAELAYRGGAAYVFSDILSPGTFVQVAKLTSNAPGSEDLMGNSVSVSGSLGVVSNHGSDDNGSNKGAVFVYSETSYGVWDLVTELFANDADAHVFGVSVMLHGRNLVVGTQPSTTAGAAYIFSETGLNTWTKMEKLVASDTEAGDVFGSAVAISGGYVIAGASGVDDPYYMGPSQYFYMNYGAAYIRDNEICTPGPACVNGYCINYNWGVAGCECETGWTGALCEVDIDDCASSPCMNDGQCTDTGANMFECDCGSSGFEGDVCQSDVNDCLSSPCLNDGLCSDVGANLVSCNCTGTGFHGIFCETDIDDCASSPCLNEGNCTDTGPFQYSCECTGTGFEGDQCQSNIDECISSPCLNNGSCKDTGANSYSCDCSSTGFEGDVCQTDINDCLSSPCMNNGICTDAGVDMFVCECTDTGFEGDFCEQDVNDCISSPCLHDGECTDRGINAFECNCNSTGYEGLQCETDVDDCSSSPCANYGVCTDAGLDMFTCTCTSGFTGTFCAEDVNECSSSPCMNGATCTDEGTNMFLCTCPESHTGVLCNEAIHDETHDNSVEFEFSFTDFEDDSVTSESFLEVLPLLLTQDIGGEPEDYQVSIVSDADGYTVVVVYVNPDNEDVDVLNEMVMSGSAVNEQTTDLRVIHVVEEEEVESDGTRILPNIIAVLGGTLVMCLY